MYTRGPSRRTRFRSLSVPPRPAAILIVTRCGLDGCHPAVSCPVFPRVAASFRPNDYAGRAKYVDRGRVFPGAPSPTRDRSRRHVFPVPRPLFRSADVGYPAPPPPHANSSSTTSRRLRNTCSVIIVLFLIDFRTAVVHVVRRVRFLSYADVVHAASRIHAPTRSLSFCPSFRRPSCLYVLFLIPGRVRRRNLLALLAQGNRKYEYELICNIVEKSKKEKTNLFLSYDNHVDNRYGSPES